jgi:hypothetical protein
MQLSPGLAVGDGVGLGVGLPLGLLLGETLGEGVGLAVGDALGDTVGDALALGVGDALAEGEGDGCGAMTSRQSLSQLRWRVVSVAGGWSSCRTHRLRRASESSSALEFAELGTKTPKNVAIRAANSAVLPTCTRVLGSWGRFTTCLR